MRVQLGHGYAAVFSQVFLRAKMVGERPEKPEQTSDPAVASLRIKIVIKIFRPKLNNQLFTVSLNHGHRNAFVVVIPRGPVQFHGRVFFHIKIFCR